jgi:hypothetical protein
VEGMKKKFDYSSIILLSFILLVLIGIGIGIYNAILGVENDNFCEEQIPGSYFTFNKAEPGYISCCIHETKDHIYTGKGSCVGVWKG